MTWIIVSFQEDIEPRIWREETSGLRRPQGSAEQQLSWDCII
jgi:hypothetical protein